MNTTEAVPVPVVAPPFTAAWVVCWPCHAEFTGKFIGWAHVPTDYEKNAREIASIHAGSRIFRLPGDGEQA